ncbi:MAG: FimV/HubP family polar landmark protein [Thiohalophilus sp.]|uniref:FimV/HubP family polar landmark protein n=1 Tax=Thiohalophilus sp. TaxID=3028392 RepID=UPI002870A83B|nr:FimV/HubP family polar landmark protein [Thiohalophilus sp.]MDR9437395.1 FimV/HubP family polar landmark protein [Thiohalophilus sp.]
MLRKLLVGLASACLILVPLTAQALGFGNIKLNSALNEPLDARIELISPTSSDLDSLTVKLAPEGAFTRAGIDRPHFLSGLKFEVVEEGGDSYIKVNSRDSIREPFVNFLLEFSWDNGRMLREYTMLLDPPGRVTREPAPAMAETPVTEEPADTIERYEPQPYSPEPAAPAEPQPAEPAPAAADEPAMMEEEADEPEVIEVAPATEEAAAEDEAWKTSDAFVDDGSLFPRIDISGYRSDIELGELDYGVTKDGDNAWTIAKKLQSNAESASIYQIMMALLQSNPDAFIEGNVHRLKSGQVLRIEDPSLLDAMSRQQAANEYMAQTESWNDYRQAVAERTGRQAVVAEAGAGQAPARAESGGELTLSSPDGEDLQSGAGASEEAMSNDLVALQDEMRQLRENASSTRERNVELNRQLQDMEEELARLQRSVSIKDDELAALQQQLAELNAEPALPETPALQEEVAVEEAVEPQPAEDAVESEQAMRDEEAGAPADAEMAPQPEAEAEPAPAQPPQEEPVEPEAPAAEEAPQATSTPQSDSEPKGMVEEYLTMAKEIFNSAVGVVGGMIGASGNSLLMYVAAPVLLVLVILMLIVMRRRRQAEGNYQESILSGGPSTVTSSTDSTDTGESSFLSDFAVSGAGAIQTEDSEVDPLTEADVFMAYGRYEAAEERLQEAIEQEPGRKELKLKLLELYSATGNSNAFENLAEEFYASLGGEAESDPQWEKVVAMGKELAPNNPLFAAGAAAAAAAAPNLGGGDASTGLSDSQVMDIGLDTGVFEESDFAGSQQGTGGDSELDFNLDFGTESDTAPATSEESAGGMDFNFDMGSEPASSEGQAEAGSELDFNLDMGTEETPAGSSEADTGDLDFNLGDDDTAGAGLDFNLGGDEDTGNELDFNLGADESDTKNDLEFNLDSGTESPDTESELSLDSGAEAPSADTGGLDFNLGDEDNTLSLDTGSEEPQGTDEEQTMAIDAGGLDFGGGDQGGMDLDLDASDAADSEMSLGGGDEVGTKLDLARAYIDMGDPDGARSILDEVLDEGDDSQKQEAQQLLQQIA